MTETWRPMLDDIRSAFGLAGEAGRVMVTGGETLPSCFAVTDLAVASISAACLAVSDLTGGAGVTVDRRLASLWFQWSIRPEGWTLPPVWDAMAGDYQARDGWIRLHTNAPLHRDAALSVLGSAPTGEATAAAVAGWDADALEQAVVEAGGCAAVMRTRDAWSRHPQGLAVGASPLVAIKDGAGRRAFQPGPPNRPLQGLKVLDLTRILAGPVATRFLAGYGAQVLRIDPPGWDEPVVAPEVTLGKTCARLDLSSTAGRAAFQQLLSEADVLIHGYRLGALDDLGFGAEARQAIRPGLVDVSLNAYGQTGPWSRRRGFDSLVQMSCGIAAAGMAWKGAARPFPLPVQALDHATGYLIAAAALRGLAKPTGSRATLSLARTAKLLMDHPVEPRGAETARAGQADYAEAMEQTDWGPLSRLRPPAQVEGAPMAWDLPASPLGSGAPRWAD